MLCCSHLNFYENLHFGACANILEYVRNTRVLTRVTKIHILALSICKHTKHTAHIPRGTVCEALLAVERSPRNAVRLCRAEAHRARATG